MAQAAVRLNLHFNSFKKRAIELGCYMPNQSGAGIKKTNPKVPLEEIIFQGVHPHYQSFKLKRRLLDEGLKNWMCEVCKHSVWMNKPIPLELHHLDGNRSNHDLANLQLICPNCHSQTETFRSKNRKI